MPLLSIRGLSHAYGTNQVLDRLALEVRAGEWVGLLGVNGAGKTTLLRCAAGLIPVPEGRIVHAGMALSSQPTLARQGFGFAVDPGELPDELALRQYLDLVVAARGCKGLGDAAAELFAGFALEPHAEKPLAACSFGTKQKAAIVAAFVGSPPLILLDEPFNGLDATSQLVAKMVFSRHCQQGAILMASHVLEVMAEWCSRILCLRDGAIGIDLDLRQWRTEQGDVRQLERQLVTGTTGEPGDTRQVAAAS